MKRLLKWGSSLVIIGLLSFSLAQGVGSAAQDFSLLDENGELIRLSDFAGTPLILNFWATWCAPCIEELPFFAQVHDEVNLESKAGESALNVLLVNNNESADKASSFLREELDINLPVALDATKEQLGSFRDAGVMLDNTLRVLRDYRVRGMPTTFFIDADGIVQGMKVGFLLPSEMPELLASIGVEWQP